MAFIPLNRVHWLYWLALLWCSVYLLLTLFWWQQTHQQGEQIRRTEQLMPLLLPVQHLIQQLQLERGLSAGQVTPSLPYKPALQIQYLLTDAAWRDLSVVLEQHRPSAENMPLNQLTRQHPLLALRQEVTYNGLDLMPTDGAAVIKAYSAVIKPLLQFVQLLRQEGKLDWQQHSTAISSLTEAIERAGLERALLHIATAEQEMTAGRHQNYVFVVNEQRDFLQEFEAKSPATVLTLWQQWQQSEAYQQLVLVREQALQQQFSVTPAQWFSLATQNINQLYLLQRQLQFQLQQDLAKAHLLRQQMLLQLQLHQQLIVLLLLLLLWRMYRLNRANQPVAKNARLESTMHNQFSN
ncbi:nitrate- and nitrite sensing domain-containing protein [Rheinheimera sp.]|uniref:nitrate- and nitrite sensing domain-containing protein n=1 Tax=Rheinheimera sp. TaxID=1869214 RepID=UPI0027BA658D|nr:nitrate- and nitrite sensing domain-containing protein [Rheinheimera sp.]